MHRAHAMNREATRTTMGPPERVCQGRAGSPDAPTIAAIGSVLDPRADSTARPKASANSINCSS